MFVGNNFVGNVDYDTGLYSVMFTEGDTAATFCVNITDDELSEEEETFGLVINNASLPACVIRGNPYTANVTILHTECTCSYRSIAFVCSEKE